jgi:hypothetical protein
MAIGSSAVKHTVVRLFCSVRKPITLYILVNRMRLLCLQEYIRAMTRYGRDGDGINRHRTTKAGGKRTHVFVPRVGLEPTLPVFEHSKTQSWTTRGNNKLI